jgi:hypothetical protein
MRKKRHVETENERFERTNAAAQERGDRAVSEDGLIDRMIKRSIAEHGA